MELRNSKVVGVKTKVENTPSLPKFPFQVPEEIWIKIFSQLPSDSMFNAMQAYNDWQQVFKDSHLLDKFQLVIDKDFMEFWDSHHYDLPKVPIKRLKIKFKHVKSFIDVLKIYKQSVKDLELELEVEDEEDLANLKTILKFFSNVTSISIEIFDNIYRRFECDGSKTKPLKFPQLKTLKVIRHGCELPDFMFNFFKFSATIEEISVTLKPLPLRMYTGQRYLQFRSQNRDVFDNFLSSLPNLKSFRAPREYIDECNILVKVEKFSLQSLGENREQQMKFLKFHKGTLKCLKLEEMPIGDHGGDVIKFIFEQMNLESLFWNETPLIINHERQQPSNCMLDIKKGDENDNILANMALAEYITIDKIKIDLYGMPDTNLTLLNRPSKVFSKVKELTIENPGIQFNSLQGFFENVKHVEKLNLKRFFNFNDRHLNTFKTYLATLTQLKMLGIEKISGESLELFKAVHESCGNLKTLILYDMPMGKHGGDAVKYIFEQMNLENLFWGETPLIVNHELQQPSNYMLDINYYNLSANMSFAEYITIKKIKISFYWITTELIHFNRPSSTVFSKVNELIIEDFICDVNSNLFQEFFENIKHIEKLNFKIGKFKYDMIKTYFETFTQLKEIEVENLKEVDSLKFFEVVREFCKNLMVLRVDKSLVEEAKKFFGGSLIIENFVEENNDYESDDDTD